MSLHDLAQVVETVNLLLLDWFSQVVLVYSVFLILFFESLVFGVGLVAHLFELRGLVSDLLEAFELPRLKLLVLQHALFEFLQAGKFVLHLKFVLAS